MSWPELGAGNQIYRWGAGGIVAFVDRDVPLDALRGEVARIAGKRLDTTFQTGGRTVMVPLSLAWSVIAGGRQDSHSLLQQVDKFVRSVESAV